MNLFNLSDVTQNIWNRLIAIATGMFAGSIKKEKCCKACGAIKPLTDFYQHKGHRNRSHICKICHIGKNKLSGQIFRERNPEYNSEMNKKDRKRKSEILKLAEKLSGKG